MAVTREQFESGMTYEQYKAQMTRNRERLEAAERNLSIAPDQLAAFKNLPESVNVLAIAEDWCGDVIANLPIVARLAQESGKLNLRILLRDQNLDVMDQYLNKGEFRSIPVFVFLDQQFNELGVFIERPQSVTELRNQRRAEIFQQNPDFGSPDAAPDQLPEETRARLQQALQSMRDSTVDFANAEVVKQLRSLVAAA